MVLGTFLLFWSLAGFAIAVIERTRGVYFRGLTMFTTRQIASKVNTAFVSLSVVCIMLFFSLTVFSTGMGLARAFTGNIEDGTVYDATLTANVYLNAGGTHDPEKLAAMSEEDREYQRVADEKAAAVTADAEAYGWDIAAKLADASPVWGELVGKSAQLDAFKSTDVTYGELMDRYGHDTGNEKQNEALHNQGVTLIGVSQFNALAELVGRPTPVEVGEGGYAVNNTLDAMKALSQALARKGETVTVGGACSNRWESCAASTLEDTTFAASGAELIVPDAGDRRPARRRAAPDAEHPQPHVQGGRVEGDQLLGGCSPRRCRANPESGGVRLDVPPEALARGACRSTAEEVIVQSSGMRRR